MPLVDADQLGAPLRRLFAPLDDHLLTASILAGLTPAQVFVGEPQAPTWVLAWFQHRLLLSGDTRQAAQAGRLLQDEVLPRLRHAGLSGVVLYPGEPGWLEHLAELLPGLRCFPEQCEYYTCTRLQQDWRPLLPPGFQVIPVDAALFSAGLGGLDELRQEMCSERPSPQDFLDRSFGVCLVHAGQVAGWCLSEYNCDRRCEVGVGVTAGLRRRGLGTVLSLALVEMALERGMTQIGWHCWAENTASGALARRAGFTLASRYPAVYCELEAVAECEVRSG